MLPILSKTPGTHPDDQWVLLQQTVDKLVLPACMHCTGHPHLQEGPGELAAAAAAQQPHPPLRRHCRRPPLTTSLQCSFNAQWALPQRGAGQPLAARAQLQAGHPAALHRRRKPPTRDDALDSNPRAALSTCAQQRHRRLRWRRQRLAAARLDRCSP